MKAFFKRFSRLIWGTTALFSFICTSGLLIYLDNPDQFTVGLGGTLLFFGLVYLALAIGTAALLSLANGKAISYMPGILLALSIDLFLQYHIWSSFFLNYTPASWFAWEFLFLAVILLALWAVPFMCAWFLHRQIERHTVKLSCIILLTQGCVLLSAVTKFEEPHYNFKEYAISEKDQFVFGRKENVIILVVDCMGEGICKEVLEKYPDLKEALHDFTCFDRMISPLPWTMYAVPAMVTGINFPRKSLRIPADDNHSDYITRVFAQDSSLFKALKRKGFRVEGYPFLLPTISYSPEVIDNSIPAHVAYRRASFTKIVHFQLKKMVPIFLKPLWRDKDDLPFMTFEKPLKHNDNETFDQVFYRKLQTESCLGEKDAIFKYLHLQGAHEIVLTDENLKRNKRSMKYRQLRGSLKNFELLVTQMKKLGIYDNSTIVLVGDHTEKYDIHNIAFIKRRNERHDNLLFNSIPCQVSDIAGTILKEYGIETEMPSLFDQPPVAGDGSLRREQIRYLDFPPWKPIEEPTVKNTLFLNFRERFADNKLVLENFWITPHSQLTMLLSPENSEAPTHKTSIVYTQNYACLRASFENVPDGIYEITIDCDGMSELQEPLGRCVFKLPEPIKVQNGEAHRANGPEHFEMPRFALPAGIRH
ncbi:MAG: hypothetical protein IKP00_08265 [Victivallales bacterium]|nr:hypothetical protein [Victivallales bacterium]